MIELQSDELIFGFPQLLERLRKDVRGWVDERLESATTDEKNKLPSSREEVHRLFAACLPRISGTVSFQRTLRMPENGKHYPMPLGLGKFSVYPVDDFSGVPEAWRQRGGVMMPLHGTEAVWLAFYSDYPMAFRIGSGGQCAVSGEPWATMRCARHHKTLSCWAPSRGSTVSTPARTLSASLLRSRLGQGLLGVHALSGEERWGGLQLQAVPMRPEEFWRQVLKERLNNRWYELMTPIHHRAGSGAQIPPDRARNGPSGPVAESA